MADEDSHSTDLSVSCDEGHSDPLRVAVEAGARLSTPAKAAISRERKVQTNPLKKIEKSRHSRSKCECLG